MTNDSVVISLCLLLYSAFCSYALLRRRLRDRHRTLSQPIRSKLISLAFFTALTEVACVDVSSQPAQFVAVSEGTGHREVEVTETIHFMPETGYERVLKVGSRWRLVGHVSQGEVYKSVNSILTLEGTNIHEAYLVYDGKVITGFYLPGEAAYTELVKKVPFPHQPTGE